MKRDLCISLEKKARELAVIYTKKAPKNTHGVVFELDEVIICSELTACVILRKSNGQKVAIKLDWISFGGGGEWRWLTMRYDHLYGMQRILDIMHKVEQENYVANTRPVEDLAKVATHESRHNRSGSEQELPTKEEARGHEAGLAQR